MKISTTIQKTIQEVQYEPIMISVTIEDEVNREDFQKRMKKLRYLAHKELKTSMDLWINDD